MIADVNVLRWIDALSVGIQYGMTVTGANVDSAGEHAALADRNFRSLDTTQLAYPAEERVFADANTIVVVFDPERQVFDEAVFVNFYRIVFAVNENVKIIDIPRTAYKHFVAGSLDVDINMVQDAFNAHKIPPRTAKAIAAEKTGIQCIEFLHNSTVFYH